jgi:hypothetical protein
VPKGAFRGPVAYSFQPVCELHEKAGWPNFWLWIGLSDDCISTHSWAEAGSAERNSLINRAQKNFATGPLEQPLRSRKQHDIALFSGRNGHDRAGPPWKEVDLPYFISQ